MAFATVRLVVRDRARDEVQAPVERHDHDIRRFFRGRYVLRRRSPDPLRTGWSRRAAACPAWYSAGS